MNETDVIEFLENRSRLLASEKKKVDDAISVIQSSSRALAEVTSAAPERKSSPAKASDKVLGRISEFNPKGKLDDKISFALSTSKSGLKEDIMKVLTEQQPDLDVNKLRNALGVRLSYLLKNGRIAGKKQGRTYHYRLI